MNYVEAKRRLRNHSNLIDDPGLRQESFLFMLHQADRDNRPADLEPLSRDVIACLVVANLEMNGPVPSETIQSRNPRVLEELAYPVNGLIRDGLACHAKWTRQNRFSVDFLNQLRDQIGRIALAWDMLMAGDLDDLAAELEIAWNASVAQYGDFKTPLAEEIQALEERLLEPENRARPERIADLLADDFIEYGSSGRVFDKQQILAALREEPQAELAFEDFRAKTLGRNAVLATYRIRAVFADNSTRSSLRSSIWVRKSGRWQVVFHQGTVALP